MSTLRILVVANLPPYVLGGAENQVARLVEVWAGLGHHVEVAGHRIPDGTVRLGAAEIRTHRIAVVEWMGRGGRAATYFLSLARLLRRIGYRFDVVYSRGLGDGAVSIALLKAMKQVRLPLVACPINARGSGDAQFIRSIPCWRRLVHLINKHCNAINIIAPAIEPDLAELGITKPRVSHIPNGIPISAAIERDSPPRVRRLIAVGRLSQQKGMDLLLTALSQVAATGREFVLSIVGDGPEMQSLSDQCRRLSLESRVKFEGALAQAAIRDRLASADVFLLPSRYEGMSNAALEAMEAGLPILLTRCGGIDTYVNSEVGWVVDPGSVEALAATLQAMLDTRDTDLLAMGRRARELVGREFEMDAIGRRNLELLARVASSS
jgi:glycosyltransferase involved in cell wall biosynthesis